MPGRRTDEVRSPPNALIVSCFDTDEPQFRGLGAAAAELSRAGAAGQLTAPLDARGRARARAAAVVVVCGHGSEDRPRIGTRRPVAPADLPLAPGCRLYLLACHQGSRRLREAWAVGCGIPTDRVMACPGETDSALTTMLLAHIALEGIGALAARFGEWLRANEYLRPWFAGIRSAYENAGGDPVAAFAAVDRVLNLDPVRGFVEIVLRAPRYFQGLR